MYLFVQFVSALSITMKVINTTTDPLNKIPNKKQPKKSQSRGEGQHQHSIKSNH
ncbi:hypothetical protein Hanom_Chr06g00507431 [Helianthus anomalus]